MTCKQNEVNLYSIMVPQKIPFGFHQGPSKRWGLGEGGRADEGGGRGDGAAGVKRKGKPPNLLKMEFIILSLYSLLGMANLI
jgi:hypothetical protein